MVEAHDLQLVLLGVREGTEECLWVDLVGGFRGELVPCRPYFYYCSLVISYGSNQYSASFDWVGFSGMKRNTLHVSVGDVECQSVVYLCEESGEECRAWFRRGRLQLAFQEGVYGRFPASWADSQVITLIGQGLMAPLTLLDRAFSEFL